MLDLKKLKDDVLQIEEELKRIYDLIKERDSAKSIKQDYIHDSYRINSYQLLYSNELMQINNAIDRTEDEIIIIQNKINEIWAEIEKTIRDIISSTPEEIQAEIQELENILNELESDSKSYADIRAKSTRITQTRQYIEFLKEKLKKMKCLKYEPQSEVSVVNSIVGKLYHLFVYGSRISKDSQNESEIREKIRKFLPTILWSIENRRKGEYINTYQLTNKSRLQNIDIDVAIALKNELIDLGVLTEDGLIGSMSSNELSDLRNRIVFGQYEDTVKQEDGRQ